MRLHRSSRAARAPRQPARQFAGRGARLHRARLIRSRDVQHQECGECIWFGVCGGTCLAHARDIGEVWNEGCAVALNAFDRIAAAVAEDTSLQSSLHSLAP